jgi:hypothetical protein
MLRIPRPAGVFTQLAYDMGIRGTQVEEIVTMDDMEFHNLAPVYGLIFLFKWTQEMAQAHSTSVTCVEHPNLYFAKQVINNACGTQESSRNPRPNGALHCPGQVPQLPCPSCHSWRMKVMCSRAQALLNIMMNAEGISLGTELEDFRAFTADFPADLKGESMSNSETMRTVCPEPLPRTWPCPVSRPHNHKLAQIRSALLLQVHNSFARPEQFEMEERRAVTSPCCSVTCVSATTCCVSRLVLTMDAPHC